MSWRPPEPDPFVALTDDAAHQAAVEARVERHERRARATEVATWIGTLRDLAEQVAVVSVQAASARIHRGHLVAVGVDHVALRLPGGVGVLVRLHAIRSVRPEPGVGAPPAMGDRDHAQDRSLVEALEQVVARDGEVTVFLDGVADPVKGEVVGLGEDVLTLRLASGDRGVVYVPVPQVSELIVEG